MNPTERYFTLLETWLLRGHPEIIGKGRYGLFLILDNFRNWLDFFGRIPEEGMQVAGSDAEYWLPYLPGWHNLGLLEIFGLCRWKKARPNLAKAGTSKGSTALRLEMRCCLCSSWDFSAILTTS
ncbi:MAG: hypothetical protein U9R11_04165 [Chloroflexota bacterium]|nr:hypothetical protein [Chloroflexota bacterium]